MRSTISHRKASAVVLGKGRESTVYALRLGTREASVECALRVPHRGTSTDTKPARMAAILRLPPHANVVAVLGGMQWLGCGQCVLMLERIHGCTLQQSIDACAWPPGDALAASRQVVCGLAHLHLHDIRHGDVNLNNILVQGRTCKLTDYFTESPYGAPAYMAPELVRGTIAYASDVWSAACVCLALHGQHPFDGVDVAAVLWKLGNNESPENLPPCALADVIRQIFVPAEERPSAVQVLQRLDAL
jgi:p21-activated kinase 1